jgi:hypothetical protein
MKGFLYTEEFARRKFTGKTMKDAYLKAVKWYASNVMVKDELRNVQAGYEKVHDEQSPTIILHLYASLVEEEVRAAHCNICKESHKSFFISEETNCAWCKIKAYQNRCDKHIEIEKSYYKQILERSEYGE